MANMKPILFNTDMVRALLDGRKTVTRRVMKPQPTIDGNGNPEFHFKGCTKDFVSVKVVGFLGTLKCIPIYYPGDILYVRETWTTLLGSYIYRANQKPGMKNPGKWRPSIHMPREAARIFLRVTGVRVEPLQWCGNMEAKEEGCTCCSQFIRIWDSTIKKADRDLYGWEANPWVWVISFERISKEEA